MVEHYHGTVYRQCHPDHADLDATVRASVHHPFRFNPAGEFGVLYVSLSKRTARAELEKQARQLGVSLSRFRPRVMLQITADLRRVLDLGDVRARVAFGVTLAELASDDYSACHQVARLARTRSYEAIRYPSATGDGENLAIFLDRLDAQSSVEIVAREIFPLVP